MEDLCLGRGPPFTAQELRGVSVLVLVLAQGANPTNDSSAYSDAECTAIAQWVGAGGSLLLVADHWPYALRPAHSRGALLST